MTSIRVGVLGVGVMGAEHVRLLTHEVSGAEVSAVYDVDTTRATTVADGAGAQVLDDPMVLIKDDAVDCVLIASSDATHEQFVLAALAAGKPVLCEKPLAPQLAACEGIIAAETELGRRLISLGFMRRFDPGYTALRADIDGGTIGAPLVMHNVHRNASTPGVRSEFVITSSLVHEIDVARWLLDDEVDRITVHRPRPASVANGAQDPVVAVLAMRSGVHVDAEVFINAGYGYDVRCEVVGETGSLLLDNVPDVVRRSQRVVGHGVALDWRDRFRDAYRVELQDWIDAVAADRPSGAASAWDGYAALAVADAAIQALETGTQQPVRLIDRPDLYA